MTEAYLQDVWNKKRFHSPSIKLVDGTPVVILDTGMHNVYRSGPDFEMGRILIDEITFIGPIEVHVNASDWYLHNHHFDRSYDNVILHVVYNFDQEVLQNGRRVPTIEMKSLLFDFKNRSNLRREDYRALVCRKGMLNIEPVYLESMKAKALIHKLNDKVKGLNSLLDQSPSEVLYFLLMGAFGMNVNKSAFEDLAIEIPYRMIESLNSTQRMNLMLAKSGLMNEKYARSKGYVWNRKGTRPANFPWKRLGECLMLLNSFPLRRISDISSCQESICLVREELMNSECDLSSLFIDHLLINMVVPFCFWKEMNDLGLVNGEGVVDELLKIPSERNHILRWWKKVGINAETAYDSQALIGLYRYYCCHKKCLSCEVGKKLLNR